MVAYVTLSRLHRPDLDGYKSAQLPRVCLQQEGEDWLYYLCREYLMVSPSILRTLAHILVRVSTATGSDKSLFHPRRLATIDIIIRQWVTIYPDKGLLARRMINLNEVLPSSRFVNSLPWRIATSVPSPRVLEWHCT